MPPDASQSNPALQSGFKIASKLFQKSQQRSPALSRSKISCCHTTPLKYCRAGSPRTSRSTRGALTCVRPCRAGSSSSSFRAAAWSFRRSFRKASPVLGVMTWQGCVEMTGHNHISMTKRKHTKQAVGAASSTTLILSNPIHLHTIWYGANLVGTSMTHPVHTHTWLTMIRLQGMSSTLNAASSRRLSAMPSCVGMVAMMNSVWAASRNKDFTPLIRSWW